MRDDNLLCLRQTALCQRRRTRAAASSSTIAACPCGYTLRGESRRLVPPAAAPRSMIQNRRGLRIRQRRYREEISVYIAEVQIREHRDSVRRHHVAWMACQGREGLVGHRVRRDVRTSWAATLADSAVTQVATDGHVNAPSVDGIARRG